MKHYLWQAYLALRPPGAMLSAHEGHNFTQGNGKIDYTTHNALEKTNAAAEHRSVLLSDRGILCVIRECQVITPAFSDGFPCWV